MVNQHQTPEEHSWSEYRRLVLKSLEDINKELDEIKKEAQTAQKEAVAAKVELTTLKTKISVWAAIAGFIGSLIPIILSYYLTGKG